MFAFAGGFVALFRILAASKSRMALALAWLGLAVRITTASSLAILQAADGIALKIAVNDWYAIPSSSPSVFFLILFWYRG